MRCKSLLAGLVCSVFLGHGFAGEPAKVEAGNSTLESSAYTIVPNARHKILTLSIGNDWLKAGQAQSLTLLPPFENYYTTSRDRRAVLAEGAFLGGEYWKSPSLGFQLGLGGYIDGAMKVNGVVWQLGLPQFANLYYSYRTQSQRLVLEGKAITTVKHKFHPYLSGDLGITSNRSYSYREAPLASNIVPMLPFNDNNCKSFTYSVGLGVDVDMSKNIRLGLGYQYVNLGKFALDPSPSQVTSQTLVISPLDGQSLRLQLTFVI